MDDNGFELENVIIKSEDKSLSEEDPEMVGNILIVKKEEEKLNEADFKYERLNKTDFKEEVLNETNFKQEILNETDFKQENQLDEINLKQEEEDLNETDFKQEDPYDEENYANLCESNLEKLDYDYLNYNEPGQFEIVHLSDSYKKSQK